ncbi:MAG TPA: glycosyltransferase [Aggregatilinea sp.]|uniref:glycosyltransferase n=1 Tax=Aggregatilinea sp. TaxID=2806333 RepID=UPI002BC179DA|nr:glycosyltransferase [Aggregatilinea sp.]HML20178.1 glycosyltransferase [Aggregatilinea sp.]
MTGARIHRIAMLSVHTSPLAALGGKKTGGMNVYVRDLSREIGRRGIDVDIYTRRDSSDLPKIAPLADHVRVIHVPCGPKKPLGTAEVYPFLPEFAANAAKLTGKKASYDVIFSHYWLSGWAAHSLQDAWSAPTVQMFHTLGRMKNRVAQQAKDQEAEIRITTELESLGWSDRIIAATPAERAQLLWLYRADRRKIEVIPPGVDTQRFHRIDAAKAKQQIGINAEQRIVLFVGRIEPLKGIDTLLRAVALLRQDGLASTDDVCVVVIGGQSENAVPDAETARLLALRDELGLKDQVTFAGARDQETLPAYYSAAEVLVMPSDYESFGLVALEAMACGTPVIASEVGGLAFLVEDGVTGFHVPYRDPHALANRIGTLITTPELRESMGDAAQRVAAGYDWSAIADRVLGLFERVQRQYRKRHDHS